ncbi:MAG: hypothetical protein A2W25_13950 [candidate division Zixibacteria bacterium RBG_16_53_22]|nr:MAG: hypothetical protein A2W25_13950 [candidate division Zixibacteria bacterium RBG_16_53_22]
MDADGRKFKRKSIRLQGYDYSNPGGYAVTICTAMKLHYFGHIEKGEMTLSDVGKIAAKCWIDIPRHFTSVSLDRYIVMPNHVHGILWLNNQHRENKTGKWMATDCRGVQLNAPTKNEYFSRISPSKNTLGVIIRTYKAAVTTSCNKRSTVGFSWQRNYYEHIIRNEDDLNAIRQYILNNPANWANDEFYCGN